MNRDFYLPYCRWNFEPRYRSDIKSARDDAELIGLLTQVLSILCYLDVPDEEMQNRCLGSFDGSWTKETQEIASAFALSTEQIIKTKYYRDLGPAWICPACSRTKIETARPIPQKSKITFRFVAHHDHMLDEIGAARFPETVVCEDCNNIEGALKVAIEGKVRFRSGMPIGGVYRAFSFSPAELGMIFGRREPNILPRCESAHVAAAVEIYDSHFCEGLEAFKCRVIEEHQKLSDGRPPPIPPHRQPFLYRFGVSDGNFSFVPETVVDGQRKKRSFISEYRKDDVYVLKRSAVPFSDDEIDVLKDEYVSWVTSSSFRFP